MNLTRAQRYLLSLCSGILLSISFPFTGSITPLVFIGFVPLLFLSEDLQTKSKGGWHLFIQSYLAFLIFNLGTTWWVANSSFVGALLAFVFNTLFMSLTFVLFHVVKKGLRSNWAIWTLIPLWISFEYFHFNWELSWPWLTLGNFFSIRTSWIQWYEFTGVFGGSLWVLSVNILLFLWIRSVWIQKKKKWNNWLIFSLFMFVLPIVFSWKKLPILPFKGARLYTVAVAQPNVDPYNEKFALGTSNEQQLQRFFKLAKTVVDSTTDLVVGPETAISQGFIESRLQGLSFYPYIVSEMKKWGDAELLIGASTAELFDTKHSRASVPIPGQRMYYESYNSSLLIPNKGEPSFIHKSKLVPGVEMIPFSNLFPFLEDLAIENGGTSGTLGIEKQPKVFRAKEILAPIVCYESIYGDFVSNQVRQGASILTVITNDGWWGDSPGYKQHFSFSALRAIENRRWVVRSANTGKSGVFDEFGHIVKETEYWKDAAFQQAVPTLRRITFYTEHGDFIGVISVLLLLLILSTTIVKLVLSKKKSVSLD
ncbi:MAG: apolipoprotein N-acyltransferase [Crocinitomicaceae bacterium]|nr:apolipoprotein N-acyltransferase [Crocinitomicaceae bacterium]